jgi:hypothetical protein
MEIVAKNQETSESAGSDSRTARSTTAGRGTSRLAIAGFVLAFLFAPIGLILSAIGVVEASRQRRKGRGWGIAGILISIVAMVAAGLVFNSLSEQVLTVSDPGCVKGIGILTIESAPPSSDRVIVKAHLERLLEGLTSAAALSKRDDVRRAVTAVAEDYDDMLKAVDRDAQPSADLVAKTSKDQAALDSLCSLGQAR